jgi:hypothetical protein
VHAESPACLNEWIYEHEAPLPGHAREFSRDQPLVVFSGLRQATTRRGMFVTMQVYASLNGGASDVSSIKRAVTKLLLIHGARFHRRGRQQRRSMLSLGSKSERLSSGSSHGSTLPTSLAGAREITVQAIPV